MAAHKKIPGNRECQQHKNNILFILLSLVLFSDRMVSNCRRREGRVLYSEVIGSSPSRYSLYMMAMAFSTDYLPAAGCQTVKISPPGNKPVAHDKMPCFHFIFRGVISRPYEKMLSSIVFASKPLKNYTDSISIMGLAIMPLQKSAEIRLFYREGTCIRPVAIIRAEKSKQRQSEQRKTSSEGPVTQGRAISATASAVISIVGYPGPAVIAAAAL